MDVWIFCFSETLKFDVTDFVYSIFYLHLSPFPPFQQLLFTMDGCCNISLDQSYSPFLLYVLNQLTQSLRHLGYFSSGNYFEPPHEGFKEVIVNDLISQWDEFSQYFFRLIYVAPAVLFFEKHGVFECFTLKNYFNFRSIQSLQFSFQVFILVDQSFHLLHCLFLHLAKEFLLFLIILLVMHF